MAEGYHGLRSPLLNKVRIAVVGAGAFGANHLRVLHEAEDAELVAVVDTDAARAQAAGEKFGCVALTSFTDLEGKVDAAIVAVPTTLHAEVGCELLSRGIDLLIEKPIATTLEQAEQLIATAARHDRVLQVGHLERFNPAVMTLEQKVTLPLFFEIHRMSLFSPRALDVDVVLDLMIHDLDIILALTRLEPEEIRAAGIRILSDKVDIANVRLAFPGGCIANLTASRVSTEKIRKIRLFQPNQYISVDYQRQDGVAFTVRSDGGIGLDSFDVKKDEPLRLQLANLLECVRTRCLPRVTGRDAARALAVALSILAKIEEHGAVVAETVRRGNPATRDSVSI
jgi:predicted dehydrogenase